jgi:hypothetical protein
MGWFGLGGKDWNIIGVIFERADLYRINGNRGKGSDATTIRDNVRRHDRCVFYAVFDQKRAFVEGGPGGGERTVPPQVLQRLQRDLHTNKTVQDVLAVLESGKEKMSSQALVWTGYPTRHERTGLPDM